MEVDLVRSVDCFLAHLDRNPILALLVALANVVAWSLVLYLWRQ